MPDHQWLVLKLEAPLLAFGGVTIDHVGVTRDFPSVSMLTGLLANALGWLRTDKEAHQDLQDRLVFAARWDRQGEFGVLSDIQNAQLAKNDKGWTTWGSPEGRDGNSYDGPHRRQRDYHTDSCMMIVLRLAPSDQVPSLDMIAEKLDHPSRPLFVGRKPCLPSAPLRQKDFVTAPTAYEALQKVFLQHAPIRRLRALWPVGEGPSDGEMVHRIIDLPDLRNWRTGFHGGTRQIVEGEIMPQGVAA